MAAMVAVENIDPPSPTGDPLRFYRNGRDPGGHTAQAPEHLLEIRLACGCRKPGKGKRMRDVPSRWAVEAPADPQPAVSRQDTLSAASGVSPQFEHLRRMWVKVMVSFRRTGKLL